MTKRSPVLIAIGMSLGMWLGAGKVGAAWPTGSIRTLPGQTCVWGFSLGAQPIFCPFVSSSDTYYAGNNSTIYVDYHVSASGTGKQTQAYACRQSYTGSAFACGSTSTAVGTGPHDLYVSGFANIGGTTTIYDYFYVTISTTETIDAVWGVGYAQ